MSRMPAIALLWALIGAQGAAGEAPPQADLGREIATLSGRVLADPLDAAAAGQLEALRQRQAQRRRDAFGALASGLRAYLDGRFALAARLLTTASAWDEAKQVADDMLLRKLHRIVAECKREAGSTVKTSPRTCPSCGDLGWADCPAKGCYGTGTRPCPSCGGRGALSSRGRPCAACNGTGAIACAACRARGVVPCTKCSAGHIGASGATREGLGPNETRAIRALIAKARYLGQGGMDLESPRAFLPSPKLQGPRSRR